MSAQRILTAIVVCGVVLGLAACGGSSGKRDPVVEQQAGIATAILKADAAVDSLDEDSSDAEVDAAVGAIATARTAVEEAGDLSADEKARFEDSLDRIGQRLTTARTRIEVAREERRREMEAQRRKLSEAVFSDGRISAIGARVVHGAAPVTMSGTIPGTPATAVTDLEMAAVGAVSTVGEWTGRSYTAADEASGTIDTVVLHTDIEAPDSLPFGGEGGKYTDRLAGDGSLPIVEDTEATLIASASFPESAGITTHMADQSGLVQVLGTFDGAGGAYVCSPSGSPCTSSVRHSGGIALEGGDGWKFVPEPGAMVATRDDAYRYFGWWQRDTGDARAVGVFHAGVGDARDEFAALATLQGPARYRGPAVGKFALDPPLGAASAGEFTATVVLRVEFGDGTDPGTVGGTVDEFVVDGEKVPWSVILGTAGVGADGSVTAGGVYAARTEWSIEGTAGKAPQTPPTWQGQLHEVNAQKVPGAATGGFEAAYGEIGRMIGAFGATLQSDAPQ